MKRPTDTRCGCISDHVRGVGEETTWIVFWGIVAIVICAAGDLLGAV